MPGRCNLGRPRRLAGQAGRANAPVADAEPVGLWVGELVGDAAQAKGKESMGQRRKGTIAPCSQRAEAPACPGRTFALLPPQLSLSLSPSKSHRPRYPHCPSSIPTPVQWMQLASAQPEPCPPTPTPVAEPGERIPFPTPPPLITVPCPSTASRPWAPASALPARAPVGQPGQGQASQAHQQ